MESIIPIAHSEMWPNFQMSLIIRSSSEGLDRASHLILRMSCSGKNALILSLP